MTVAFSLIIRRARRLSLLVTLGICLGGAAGRVLATQSVDLNWSPSPSDDIVSYNVYIGTQSGVYTVCVGDANFSEFVTNGAEICDLSISGLADGVTYYFEVTSVDAAGNESERSAEASYTIGTTGGLALQVQTTTAAFQAAQVSWTPSPESDVYGYLVSYGTQSGVYTSSVEFDYATSGMIFGLADGTTNYFVVSPIDAYGVQPISSSEVAFVVSNPPLCQVSVQVTTNTPGVSLSWNDLTAVGAAGYNVYYGTQSSNYTQAVSCAAVTNLVVTGLQGGQTYYFAVAPVDVYGDQGPQSLEAVAVAPLPAPMVLQMQTFTDDSGQPYGMQINTYSVVSGAWELDTSTNLQNWTYYTSGSGSGTGNGYDMYAWIPIDPTVPQMFFRVVQPTYVATTPAPMVLQSQILTDGNGQPYQMEINTYSVVSGAWEMETSTDLQTWTPFQSGTGPGNGDGYDVDVFVPFDPAAPQKFFRVVQ